MSNFFNMKQPSKIILLILTLLIISSCAYYWISKSTHSKKYNLVIISLDTLRADRLGAYGYDKFPTSPNIDQFAAKSVVFEDAISVSSWTLPTHMTLFTGLYPSTHGVKFSKNTLTPKHKLLAEVLKENGYKNLAYTGGGFVNPKYGFGRGFDKYRFSKIRYFLERANNYDIIKSIADLKKDLKKTKDQPFFIFLHTYDIHCPYTPPPKFKGIFNSKNSIPTLTKHCEKGFASKKLSAGQVQFISDRYDEGIRFVDHKLGELFKHFEESDLLKNTIIILTSDHGEEFGEHGRIGHNATLYQELLRIPLIIYHPEFAPGKVSTQVGLVDIFDTVLDFLNINRPAKSDGLSLKSIAQSKDAKDYVRTFQFSERSDAANFKKSHIDKFGHYISDAELKEEMLFNLVEDPQEQKNISASSKKEVQRRKSELNLLIRSLTPLSSGKERNLSTKEIQQLKSLGYF